MEDVIRILQSITPFSSLSDSVLREVAPRVHLQEFPCETYVFRQGTPSLQALYIVVSGLAEVTVTNNRGHENVVGYRHRHDFFGETVVLTADEEYPGAVRAKEDLTCLVIPREVFEGLMYHHPEVARFFSRVMLSRMRRLYQEMVAEQAPETSVRAEATLFRRRAAEIMSAPVITCRATEPISNVASLMVDRNISAVAVVDDVGQPLGLVTERDLVAQLTEPRRDWPAHLTAEKLMRNDLVRIPVTAYLHEVLVHMIKHGAKHLAVMESGLLVGIISVVDLARARSTGTLLVAHRIETLQTLEELHETSREIDNFLNALVAEKTAMRDILAILSELHDAFTRRVIQLCEAEFENELGPKPAEYCWLALGSAGRREQTIRTDQDNAIIYADPENGTGADIAAYFQQFGARVTGILEECGFRKCPFGVMPSNREWCRSLGEWQEHLVRLILRVNPEDIRILTILLDFRPVYGNFEMARALWDTAFKAFGKVSSGALHLVADSKAQMRVPLNLFGGFITEKSGPHKHEINLKTAACVHIVNSVRILALQHRITETSTLGRLRLLVEAGAITADDAEFIEAAYETLLMFRTREGLRKLRQGAEPDNYLRPGALSKREQEILKDALSVISRLQNITSSRFGELWNYPGFVDGVKL
ncbi:MAG: CBS domain-containing protein [Candidatus Desulforudis sp.]|nr:CBS domain-containing protein [Desulforudis sp.]